MSSIALGNGWIMTEMPGGDVVIRPDRMRADQYPIVRIREDGITVCDEDGELLPLVESPEATRAIRTALLGERNKLYGHRYDKMVMWQQLYLKFAEADEDDPHPAYRAAVLADAFIEKWEEKRKELGLPYDDG